MHCLERRAHRPVSHATRQVLPDQEISPLREVPKAPAPAVARRPLCSGRVNLHRQGAASQEPWKSNRAIRSATSCSMLPYHVCKSWMIPRSSGKNQQEEENFVTPRSGKRQAERRWQQTRDETTTRTPNSDDNATIRFTTSTAAKRRSWKCCRIFQQVLPRMRFCCALAPSRHGAGETWKQMVERTGYPQKNKTDLSKSFEGR